MKMKNTKPQFFNTREQILKWLKKYKINNFTINETLIVDIKGDLNISFLKLKTIPIKFGVVTGSFWCHHNKLTNLTGSPKTVGGDFDCSYNKLTTLVGSPKLINGNFFCHENELISILELRDHYFKNYLFFNINKTYFQQKELIQVLDRYYNTTLQCYLLAIDDFTHKIKPVLQKEILHQKLIVSDIKIKTKTSFI